MKHDVRVGGRHPVTYDPMSKDAVLLHWTDDGDVESVGTQFVIETRKWFDSVWNSIVYEVPR